MFGRGTREAAPIRRETCQYSQHRASDHAPEQVRHTSSAHLCGLPVHAGSMKHHGRLSPLMGFGCAAIFAVSAEPDHARKVKLMTGDSDAGRRHSHRRSPSQHAQVEGSGRKKEERGRGCKHWPGEQPGADTRRWSGHQGPAEAAAAQPSSARGGEVGKTRTGNGTPVRSPRNISMSKADAPCEQARRPIVSPFISAGTTPPKAYRLHRAARPSARSRDSSDYSCRTSLGHSGYGALIIFLDHGHAATTESAHRRSLNAVVRQSCIFSICLSSRVVRRPAPHTAHWLTPFRPRGSIRLGGLSRAENIES